MHIPLAYLWLVSNSFTTLERACLSDVVSQYFTVADILLAMHSSLPLYWCLLVGDCCSAGSLPWRGRYTGNCLSHCQLQIEVDNPPVLPWANSEPYATLVTCSQKVLPHPLKLAWWPDRPSQFSIHISSTCCLSQTIEAGEFSSSFCSFFTACGTICLTGVKAIDAAASSLHLSRPTKSEKWI